MATSNQPHIKVTQTGTWINKVQLDPLRGKNQAEVIDLVKKALGTPTQQIDLPPNVSMCYPNLGIEVFVGNGKLEYIVVLTEEKISPKEKVHAFSGSITANGKPLPTNSTHTNTQRPPLAPTHSFLVDLVEKLVPNPIDCIADQMEFVLHLGTTQITCLVIAATDKMIQVGITFDMENQDSYKQTDVHMAIGGSLN